MSFEGLPAEASSVQDFSAPPETYEDQKPGEACGVFGIYAPGEPVAKLAYYGLQELQHRGQNGAGIMVNGDMGIFGHTGEGYLKEAIPEAAPRIDANTGREFSVLDAVSNAGIAIGHTRYATQGSKPQPIKWGEMAVAMNGHVELFEGLPEAYGLDPQQYESDTDYIAALYSQQTEEMADPVLATLDISNRLNGAFSTVIMDDNKMIAVRDPWAHRPLSIGALPEGGFVVASEGAAIERVGANFVRDMEKGEIVVADERGLRSLALEREEEERNCMFEYVYFARPDSTVNGVSVYRARENMGRALAKDFTVAADIVVGVRESGTSAAIGYSKESGLFKEEGLFKNQYVQRTFIEGGIARKQLLNRKQRVNRDVVEGQRVVLVDDSIIKGNTMADLVFDLKEYGGAAEVHVRSAAPRYMYPCYMGMDTRDDRKLIARMMSNEQIAGTIGADSVAFNSLKRVRQSIMRAARTESAAARAGNLCDSCITGEYAFPVPPCQAPISAQKIVAKEAMLLAA